MTRPCFTCPVCGSHAFGTEHCDMPPEEQIGQCHGFGCRYTWRRSEDAEKHPELLIGLRERVTLHNVQKFGPDR